MRNLPIYSSKPSTLVLSLIFLTPLGSSAFYYLWIIVEVWLNVELIAGEDDDSVQSLEKYI